MTKLLATGLFLAVSIGPTHAINIVPVFNQANNETPTFDIFNQGIQDLFSYSEGYFQDIYEDIGHTLTINYWYEDLDDSFIGFFNPVTTVGNRITEANIRIDTRLDTGGDFRNWYIDSTPASDGEFDMEQMLWEDVAGPAVGHWTGASSVPDTLEVGYQGIAKNGSAAHLKYDMLSTILHEFGHALGIRGGADHENADDDYDLNSSFMFGGSLAAEIDVDQDGADPGHVRPESMLMCGGCGSTSRRRRPGHADLFALATSNGYSDIDVPRREYYGGGVFNFAPNWSGNRTPDFNDDAYVRSGGLAVMNASDTVANLYISRTDLATSDHTLTSGGILRVDSPFSNVRGKLIIGLSGEAIAENVEIAKNGEIDLAGGTLNVEDDLILTERDFVGSEDGLLSGNGVVNVWDLLSNTGEIKPEGGTLTINADRFDLDGNGSFFGKSKINATLGSVVFNGPHIGTFDDQIDIGFAQLATFSHPWTLSSNGELTITDGGLINNGAWIAEGIVQIDHTVPFGVVGVGGTGSMRLSATSQTTTSGIVDFLGPSVIEGQLHVTSDSARLSGGGTITGSAVVTLDPNSTLNLVFNQTYTIASNATFTGGGEVVVAQLATSVFEHGSTIGTPLMNQGRIELGNSSGKLNMDDTFTQEATGVIEFELGGYLPGCDFDVFDATGQIVSLDGTLELSVINGFSPLPGDTFEIITAASVVDTFTTVIGTDLVDDMFFEVFYFSDAVIIEVNSGLSGDFDNNGQVNGFDFLEWQRGFGSIYDSNDLTDWEANYGNAVALSVTSTAVPESSTCWLLVLGMVTRLISHRTAESKLNCA
ncbi:MAG: hypothetical protein ABGX16_17405 [Pirellulales bacterium]